MYVCNKNNKLKDFKRLKLVKVIVENLDLVFHPHLPDVWPRHAHFVQLADEGITAVNGNPVSNPVNKNQLRFSDE